jgi:hypothetical protein
LAIFQRIWILSGMYILIPINLIKTIEVVFLLKVCIQSIRIYTVGDAGSFNVGTTLNIISKKGGGEEAPQQVETPTPEPTPPTTMSA